MAMLRTLSGPQPVAPLTLTEAQTTIGRAEANAYRLQHRSVSKYHVLIIADEDQHLLFDLDSTNGTFLNNQKVSSAPLKNGDHLRLGEFVIAFESEVAAAAETKAAPPSAPVTVTMSKPKVVSVNQAAPDPIMVVKSQPKEPSGKPLIRVPGEKQATASQPRKTSTVMQVSRTGPVKTDTPPPPPPPPAAPTPAPATPPAAATTDQPIAKPAAAGGGGAEEKIIAKPGGSSGGGGEKLLRKPGTRPGGEIALKRPGSPKKD